jgi:hypothetical protein
LFLEIHQDSGTCNYYFAQHDLRTIFWLHALDTISVGLPYSFSSGHLRTFVTYAFPCQLSYKLPSRIYFAGKLLDSCRTVPRDRFSLFFDGPE